MRTLTFDTETTGLPLWREPDTHEGQPFCLELGWIYSPSGEYNAPASRGHLYINHKAEITLTPEAAAVNGLTVEFPRDAGVGPNIVLVLFMQLLAQAEVVIGHNVDFDKRIMRIMAARADKLDLYDSLWQGKAMRCTKQMGRSFLGLGRWHLSDLHAHFYGHPHKGAHGALADTEATWACHHAMQEFSAGRWPPTPTSENMPTAHNGPDGGLTA